MIKIKLNQIVTAVALGSLPKLVADTDVPIATRFRLARISKQIFPEYEEFQAQREKLVMKHCETDDKGFVKYNDGVAKFLSATDNQEFNDQIKALGDTDVELIGEPFVLADFEPRKMDAPELFSSADLMHLDWLILESKPEPEKASD